MLAVRLIDESRALKEAKAFLEKELNAKIDVYDEEDPQLHDPRSRAQLAKPYRPAIFIE
jgi:hypothetical protein